MDKTKEWTQARRKHIFAIDNTPEFLDVIRSLFQDEHYNVTTTNYVPRTYEQIAALQPNLLIVDLGRNEQTARELLEQLQVEIVTRHIPVIVTATAPYLIDHVLGQREQFGGNTFIVKPLDTEELLGAVRSLIGPA